MPKVQKTLIPESDMDAKLFEHPLYIPTSLECSEAKSCFNNFLHCLSDVYYQTDMEGVILAISPSAEAHLGYKPEEMVGKKMADFYFSPEDRQKVVEEFVSHQGRITRVIAALRHKTGDIVWASTDAAIRFGSKGEPLFIEGLSRNVSKEKKLELELQQEITKRKLLVQVLCHDLVTPLNNVLGILALSEREVLESLDALKSSATSGVELISLVRYMQVFEEEGSQFSLTKVNVSQVLEAVKENFKAKLEHKKITLSLQTQPDLFVLAEPISLKNSVLGNFVSNAIKFSEARSTIEMVAQREGDWVSICVNDHGIGMSQRMKEQLFTLGKTTSRKGTANEDGSGWGMKLANFFIEKYQGRIEVVSHNEIENPKNIGTSIKALIPVFKQN